MADPSVNPAHAPASILDIITFGYKSAFKTLWPVSKLTLPWLLLYTLCQSYSAMQLAIIQTRVPQEIMAHMGWIAILALLFMPVFLYLHYGVARYVRDYFWTEPEGNSFRYLLPQKTVLGVLGIVLLTIVASVPITIAGLIGLLFLIIPGLIIFTYFYSASSLAYVNYLYQPEQGVLESIFKPLRLLKGHFWRTVGLGFLSFLVLMIISGPLSVFQQVLSAMGKFNPSFMYSWLFYALYTVNMLVMVWFNLCIGYVGTLFITNRYLADLQARASEEIPLTLNVAGFPVAERQPMEP